MGNPTEKLEDPDFESESEGEAAENAKPGLQEVKDKQSKGAETTQEDEVMDYPERRQELVDQRKKPTEELVGTQQDRIDETLQKSGEEEEIVMERQLLTEQLEKSGLKLSEEEMQILYANMPEFVDGISPEFSAYLQEMMPRMEEALNATEAFKKDNNEYKAIETLSDFLGDEMDQIEKIKDENTKGQILSFIKSTIDVDQVIADMKKQTTVEGATELIKIVPIVGPGIDLAEAARGRTSAGEKLSGGRRVGRAAVGTAFMVLDVAGFVSGGATTAARVGLTTMKAGKGAAEAAKAAKGAYTAAKAAEKVGRTASMAAKGVQVGRSVTRFAALCRKTTKLKGISQTIFKVGKLIQKYPRLSGVISKTISLRSKYKTIKSRTSLVRKAAKVVKVGRVATSISKINSSPDYGSLTDSSGEDTSLAA